MKAYEIDFVEPPHPGLKLKIDGVGFELRGVEPYTRSSGTASTLLVWRGECAHCGEMFEAKTGLQSKTITKRCERHRARGVPATKAAASRMAAWTRFGAGKGKRHAQR